jgi:hypothetical protein
MSVKWEMIEEGILWVWGRVKKRVKGMIMMKVLHMFVWK